MRHNLRDMMNSVARDSYHKAFKQTNELFLNEAIDEIHMKLPYDGGPTCVDKRLGFDQHGCFNPFPKLLLNEMRSLEERLSHGPIWALWITGLFLTTRRLTQIGGRWCHP